MAVFRCFFGRKKSFPGKTVNLFQPLILAINEDFLRILRGVRILLTHCNRIEHKIWHYVLCVCWSCAHVFMCSLVHVFMCKYSWQVFLWEAWHSDFMFSCASLYFFYFMCSCVWHHTLLCSCFWYHTLREAQHSDMPWPGFLLGQTPASIWWGDQDEEILELLPAR